jgi:hypothetical protein
VGQDSGGGGGTNVQADLGLSKSDQEDVDLAKAMEERRKKREADAARYNLGQMWQTPEGSPTATMGFDTTSESAPGPMATKERKWW